MCGHFAPSMECQPSLLSQPVAALTHLFYILRYDIRYFLKEGVYRLKKKKYMVCKEMSRGFINWYSYLYLGGLIKICRLDLFWLLRNCETNIHSFVQLFAPSTNVYKVPLM